jgi:hypothetical protein
MSGSESQRRRDLECMRLASDLTQLASATLNPDLQAHWRRSAEIWSNQAEQAQKIRGRPTFCAAPRDGYLRMRRLEKGAAEKELIARLTSNKEVNLKNQKYAELLRSRIEELNRLLALLASRSMATSQPARLQLVSNRRS